MKKLVLILAALVAVSAFADEYVQGYYRKNGTYVEGHHRTAPDGNPFNNYSTQGNVNPYTGQPGTVNPYLAPQPVYTPQPVYPSYPSFPRTPICGVTSTGQYICR